MKILQISTPFLPVSSDLKYGGSERIVYLLDQELHSRGLSEGVVAPHGSLPASYLYPTISREIGVDDILDKSKNSGFTGLALRLDHIAQSIGYVKTLEDVDVVHLHDENILPFDFLINKPSLLTLHSDVSSFWDLSINPFLKERKSKLVSISQSQKGIYEAKGHRVDYVVYNGVEEEKFSMSEKTHPYLLILGSIQPVKGQDTAIEVARKTGLDLIIAGNIGNSNFFEEKVNPHVTHYLTEEKDKLNAYLSLKDSQEGKIIYVGPVDDKQKAPLYSHAKAFLMPIDWEEPFGLVMVESMMSGTPVIAFNRGSIPEVVKDGTGIIVPAGNIEEMVKAVDESENINRSLCRKITVETFGKKQMVENYIKIYRNLMV